MNRLIITDIKQMDIMAVGLQLYYCMALILTGKFRHF